MCASHRSAEWRVDDAGGYHAHNCFILGVGSPVTHRVVMSRAASTVPPELNQYVASKKLRTLQPRQRDAVLAMLRNGVFSAEEAGTTLNTVADNTFP